MQKLLVEHGLGRRSQRVARAAAITASTTGLVTEAVKDAPLGFCHWAVVPGELVAMDSFYIGHLKGVGKVYQLTAIDTATRWAVVMIVLGPVTGAHTIGFVDHVIRQFRRLGVPVRAVLTDNGPEYVAAGFRAHLVAKNLTTSGSRPAHRTTTPCANASRAPLSKNAGVPRFTGDGSPRSASSKPKPTPGSSAITTGAATTATTWPAAPQRQCSTTSSPAWQPEPDPTTEPHRNLNPRTGRASSTRSVPREGIGRLGSFQS